MSDIQDTLDEREKQHGSFDSHAEIEAQLKEILHNASIIKFSDVQYIGLNMILNKVARILNDGYSHVDSWHDIAGYAMLVEQNMLKTQTSKQEEVVLDKEPIRCIRASCLSTYISSVPSVNQPIDPTLTSLWYTCNTCNKSWSSDVPRD